MSEIEKIAVIGIGNLLLMDEGIGIHVVNELEKYEIPENVEIHDGGTGGFKLIDLMRGINKVIFIDAVDTGKAPGTIMVFESKDVRSRYHKRKYSLHDTDLLDVIKVAVLLDGPPEIKILGIQPKTINYSTTLSRELEDAMPAIINRVFEEINVLQSKTTIY